VILPIRAPEEGRKSPRPWAEGPFEADGWMEVDRDMLRHWRHPHVLGVGDVAGVPKGTSAAGVKRQVPVAPAAVVACLALVLRERGIASRRLVHAELLDLLGGGLALVIMAKESSTGFTDAGGSAEWFLIAGVHGVGLAVTFILNCAALGWISPGQCNVGV
jgi:hypothetical protein